MTAEAALTKLHFLLSQDLPAPRIRELMQQSLRGELTPEGKACCTAQREGSHVGSLCSCCGQVRLCD